MRVDMLCVCVCVCRNEHSVNEPVGGANVSIQINWETQPPAPDIDEFLIEDIDDGARRHKTKPPTCRLQRDDATPV